MARDLGNIVEYVVPKGREGYPNLVSTKQVSVSLQYYSCKILENWRSKRIIEPHIIDDIMQLLANRTASTSCPPSPFAQDSGKKAASLSRNDVFRRIEEDRERHKRLRERRWVQPVAPNSSAPYPLTCFLPLGDEASDLPLDVEFENEWETTSDWNEDDEEAAQEENELCFPGEGEGPMEMDID